MVFTTGILLVTTVTLLSVVSGDYPLGSNLYTLNLAATFSPAQRSNYQYNYYSINWEDETITLPPATDRLQSLLSTPQTLTPGSLIALETRSIGLSAFDRGTRSLYYVSVRRATSYLVQYDVTKDQIVAYKSFKDRAFVTLDFDHKERRIVTVMIHDGQFDICAFYVDQNNDAASNPFASLEVLVSNLPYESIVSGVSSFDYASQSLALVVTSKTQPVCNVTVFDLATNQLKSNINVQYEVTTTEWIANDTVMAIITQPSVNTSTSSIITLNTNTAASTLVADLDEYESSPAFPGILSYDLYSGALQAVVAHPMGSLILEIAGQNVTRSVLYPKDTQFVAMVHVANCSIGQYVSGNMCKTCPIGEFAASYEQPQCFKCKPGSFSNQTGSSKCYLCEPGSFQADPGQSGCNECDVGTAQPLSGASNCTKCGTGYYSGAKGQIYCDTCLPGLFGEVISGSSVCSQCATGKFSPDFASQSCSTCQPGQFSGTKGTPQCALCPVGSYNPNLEASACLDCPTGGNCSFEGVIYPTSRSGYFTSKLDRFEFVKCVPSEACAGNDVCNFPYQNEDVYCSECTEGYFMINTICKPCPSTLYRLLLFIGISLGLVVGMITLIIKYRRRQNTLKKTGFYSSVIIGYSFFQIIALMSSFPLDWPDTSRQAMVWTWFANFNADSLASECSFKNFDFTKKYITFTFMPLIIIVAISTRVLTLWVVNQIALRCEDYWKAKFPSLFDTSEDTTYVATLKKVTTWFLTRKDSAYIYQAFCETINATTTFLSIIYIFLSSFVLSYFDCIPQTDGTYTLESNPKFMCFESDWLKLFPVFLFGLFVYVLGIPIIIGGFLRKNRTQLDTDKMYSLFGMLYIRYKQPVFYWEIVIIARKLSVVIIRLINVDVKVQASLCLVSFAIFAGLQLWKRPYLVARHNIMEFVLLVGNVIFIFLGIIYYSTGFSEAAMNALIILILVIGLIFVVVVFGMDSYVHFKILRKATEIELDEQ